MEEPPIGLRAEVRPDGVRVFLSATGAGRAGRTLGLGLLVCLGMVAGASAGLAPEALGPLGMAVVALGGLAFAASPGLEIDVRERGVTVLRVRRLGPTERWWIPLHQLKRCVVHSSSRGGDHHGLLLDDGQRREVVAPGFAREHLEWIVAAVDEARRTADRREGEGGREYAFQRHAPRDVEALRSHDP